MSLDTYIAQLVEQAVARALATARPSPAPLKLAYNITEAAEATSTSEWCIRKAIQRGELYAKQAGERGAYAIPHEALVAWLMNAGAPTPKTRKGLKAAQ